MVANRDRYQTYDVHGQGLGTLSMGCAEIGMPDSRQRAAVEIVSELLKLNDADEFVWYVPPATPEVSCYWSGSSRLLLWISPVAVTIKRDGPVSPLQRTPTYQKEDGKYLGWLLPGAEPGTGGGARRPDIATVICPVSFQRQPSGQLCPDCEIIHV